MERAGGDIEGSEGFSGAMTFFYASYGTCEYVERLTVDYFFY